MNMYNNIYFNIRITSNVHYNIYYHTYIIIILLKYEVQDFIKLNINKEARNVINKINK